MAEKKKRKSEVEKLAEQVTVDVSGWRMNDFFQWTVAARIVDKDGLHSLMASAIVDWPFEGDPRTEVTYGNMFPKEWRAALRAVDTATQRVFQDDDPNLDEGD
jgi:hypothetical protein